MVNTRTAISSNLVQGCNKKGPTHFCQRSQGTQLMAVILSPPLGPGLLERKLLEALRLPESSHPQCWIFIVYWWALKPVAEIKNAKGMVSLRFPINVCIYVRKC